MELTMSEQFDTIIYHGNCYDGFTAAWVAHGRYPKAEFVAAQYGDEPPDVAGKRVLIVDFSYPRNVLLAMREEAARLVVLDHHKTAEAALAGIPDCVFDMQRSGAGLAWDYLWPGMYRPPIVDAVEDRDLWRFAYPDTRLVHAAMSTYAMTFQNWDIIDELAGGTRDSVTKELVRRDLHSIGSTVLRFAELSASKFASRARWSELRVPAGRVFQVWAVNVPVEFVSETAEVLKHRTPHMPILGWSWDGERNDFYCSLRSRDDGPDVSEVAKLFGGGGHAHAAGFRSECCPVGT